jgi:hypothetical protein
MASRPGFGVTTIAALAVVCVPLLPVEHVHLAGIEGRTQPLVHSHALEADGAPHTESAGQSLVAPHGDHGLAVFLSTVYNGTSRFVPQPALPFDALVTIAPTFRSLGVVHWSGPQTTHGPPGPVWLTRGPPSLS